MKYTEYNEDAGRNEFGAHLESESRKYSALQSLLAGKLLEKDEVESLREFKFVQQFLDSPIGDASEAKLKKAFAAAVIMAQEQGTLPFSLADKSPIAIASAIDEGLNRVKFAYKVSKEELDVVEVADKFKELLINCQLELNRERTINLDVFLIKYMAVVIQNFFENLL